MTTREYAALIKRIFSTDDGQALLKELEDLYCNQSLGSGSEDLNYRVGKHDLVRDLGRFYNISDKELEELDVRDSLFDSTSWE